MTLVTVVRRVLPPIIGMIGVVHDRAFEAFEERLDWLEACGLLVDRVDPGTAPADLASRDPVGQILAREGDRCLPLILVDGVVVSRGVYPSRTDMARAVGQARTGVPFGAGEMRREETAALASRH
jgi:hypothetical protein